MAVNNEIMRNQNPLSTPFPEKLTPHQIVFFFSWAFAADLPEWWGKQNENPDDLLQKLKKNGSGRQQI